MFVAKLSEGIGFGRDIIDGINLSVVLCGYGWRARINWIRGEETTCIKNRYGVLP